MAGPAITTESMQQMLSDVRADMDARFSALQADLDVREANEAQRINTVNSFCIQIVSLLRNADAKAHQGPIQQILRELAATNATIGGYQSSVVSQLNGIQSVMRANQQALLAYLSQMGSIEATIGVLQADITKILGLIEALNDPLKPVRVALDLSQPMTKPQAVPPRHGH